MCISALSIECDMTMRVYNDTHGNHRGVIRFADLIVLAASVISPGFIFVQCSFFFFFGSCLFHILFLLIFYSLCYRVWRIWRILMYSLDIIISFFNFYYIQYGKFVLIIYFFFSVSGEEFNQVLFLVSLLIGVDHNYGMNLTIENERM